MKIIIKKPVEYEAKYLQVDAEVRYWDDAEVNGVEDSEDQGKATMPCKENTSWKPLIDIDSGKILNWEEGVEARTHYKVCDAGVYTLLDEEKNEIIKKDGYVPDIMCPGGDGYGDYIIMDIDKDGQIQNWKPKLDDFIDEDE